ncbi:MAG: dihydropteroate synthase [Pirellulales bacterium]
MSGFDGDPAMLDTALRANAAVCAMHMRGDPRTMQNDPRYADVTAEILEYLRRRRDALETAGIAAERVCLDPGIGFGKTHEHNLTLMREVAAFHELERPLLVGHSRKGFIGKTLGEGFQDLADRDQGTVGASCAWPPRVCKFFASTTCRGTRNALRLFAACTRP